MAAKKRLLMIDDDPDFVEVVEKILLDAGYDVDAKYNPDEGFKALKTGKYDLLLLDVLMGRGAEGIILGCTEIPLLVKPGDATVPLFDTAALHARMAVEWALAED